LTYKTKYGIILSASIQVLAGILSKGGIVGSQSPIRIMAYSSKIRSKAFIWWKTRHILLKVILYILSLAAIFVMLRYNSYTTVVSNTVIFIAAAAAFFFVFKIYRLFDHTWDGVVLEKRMRYNVFAQKSKTHDNESGDPAQGYLYVQRSNGKVKKFTVEEDEFPAIEYFRTGDHVRHHAFMKLYEKEDKSKDINVLCCGCLGLTHKAKGFCEICGLPLLLEDEEIEAAKAAYYSSDDDEYDDEDEYEDEE